jgi:signal transduction histidine kinase
MVRSVLLCDTATEVTALSDGTIGQPDLLVDVTTDAQRALEMAARTRPDVVVCRLSMEGFSGLELLRRLQDSSPESRVVVRVSADDVVRAAACLTHGASGVLATDDGTHEVLDAIRSVATGTLALSPRIARSLGGALVGAAGDVDRLTDELAEIRRSVSEGTLAKADFLSNISHELRTPVTVAKGIAYVLGNPSVGADERDDFLGQLQSSLDDLMAIVDEIITMSELERGTFRLDLAEVDLVEAIRRSIDAVRERYPSVPVRDSIASSLTTLADAERIEEVVSELLDNACRYSPEGAAVEISARSMSEGVVVSVTDHGEGLHRTVARRSFDEPFSTGEGVLRKERSGAGVGLHLARQLVVEHGGTLWTDPLPGGGTRAAFCIPPVERRTAGAAGAA